MDESLSIAVDVIVPVFGLVVVGFAFVRFGLLGEEGLKGLTRFVFYLAIPCLLFRTLADGDPTAALQPELILTYYSGVISIYLLGMGVGRLISGAGLSSATIFGMGSIFSNIVLLGIPIIQAVYGAEGMIAFTVVVSVHSIILLPTTTVLMEVGRIRHATKTTGSSGDSRRVWVLAAFAWGALAAVLKNPVLLSILAGLIYGASGLAMPTMAASFTGLVAQAAGPAALFALGGTLASCRLSGAIGRSFALVCLKMLAFPAVVYLAGAKIFALDPVPLTVLTVLACLPMGVNVYIMARTYETEVETATTATVLSMIFGPFLLAAVMPMLPA